jgi:flagellar operon protein
MMMEINGINVPFIPIGNETEFKSSIKHGDTAFDSVFREELEKIKFSSHAMKRLETRNIQLGESEIKKIQSAVERAELKGAKDSLILSGETAFIVNVPNRTVIKAMPISDKQNNIFTNIDSVVFA